MTWAPVPPGSDFSRANLAFGVVRPRGEPPRVVVRIGDHALDLARAGIAPELTAQATGNALAASGRAGEVRARAGDLLDGPDRAELLVDLSQVETLLPVAVGDYVDFYSSLHHATNLGRILRPDGEPLLPNWKHLPVGYHGRSGTVVVSGTPIARPHGLVPDPATGVPRLVASGALDLELELGAIVAGPRTSRIRADDADRHVFGFVLLNDWSARDIQTYEYQPLGPHLGKSFATTISPWVVTLDALAPHLVEPPAQDPRPDPYLQAQRPWGLDLELAVELNGTEVTRTNFRHMYWTFAQHLAHLTVNGATTGAGDLLGSGTVSGPTRSERGSLIELTWRGADPLVLADGTTRTFLEDGDIVTLRGWGAGPQRDDARVGFGEATGTIVSTPQV